MNETKAIKTLDIFKCKPGKTAWIVRASNLQTPKNIDVIGGKIELVTNDGHVWFLPNKGKYPYQCYPCDLFMTEEDAREYLCAWLEKQMERQKTTEAHHE